MRTAIGLLAVLAASIHCSDLQATEGATFAGPTGGSDIRSGLLPPPGTYIGAVFASSGSINFLNSEGDRTSGLENAWQSRQYIDAFVFFVLPGSIAGGSVGFGAIAPAAQACGQLYAGDDRHCDEGFGDPYVEIDWSRSFGTLRPSKYSDAFPILEGLSVLVGFGAVLPLGQYDASYAARTGLSIGNNIFDLAPSMAITYTTPPIIAEGTEISAKLYSNNYLENPATRYQTGSLLELDFAVTEHIGPFQIGPAGSYFIQCQPDESAGSIAPPDGRRTEELWLGGVANYDMPSTSSSLKVKALVSDFAVNAVSIWGVVGVWDKKF